MIYIISAWIHNNQIINAISYYAEHQKEETFLESLNQILDIQMQP